MQIVFAWIIITATFTLGSGLNTVTFGNISYEYEHCVNSTISFEDFNADIQVFSNDHEQKIPLVKFSVWNSLTEDHCNIWFEFDKAAKMVKKQVLEFHEAMSEIVENAKIEEQEEKDMAGAFQPVKIKINSRYFPSSLTMVQSKYESYFKTLPYEIKDLDYIFRMRSILPTKESYGFLYDERKKRAIEVDFTAEERCMPESILNRPNSVLKLKEIGDPVLAMGAAVIMAFYDGLSYEQDVDFEDRMELCFVNDEDQFERDTPFIMEWCCNFPQISIQNVKYGKPLFSHISCRRAEWMREFLAKLSIGFTCFGVLFLPLLMNQIPNRNTKKSDILKTKAELYQTSLSGHSDDNVIELDSGEQAEEEETDKNEADLFESMRWVFLDTDPVYTLSSSLWSIVALMQSSKKVVVVLTRVVFLWSVLIVYNFLVYVVVFYYHSLYRFNWFLFEYVLHLYNFLFYNIKFSYLHIYVIGPLVLTTLLITTLFPFLVKPNQLAKSFYWRDGCKIWGKSFECSFHKSFDTDLSLMSEMISYPNLLRQNMIHHLSHIGGKSFWTTVWNYIACRYCPMLRIGESRRISSKVPVLLQPLTLLVFIPVALLAIILHCLPVFSLFTNIKALLRPPKCCPRLSLWLITITPLSVIGLIAAFIIFFDLLNLSFTAIIYLVVDVVREGENTLNWIIFCFAVLVYIRDAFTDFSDKYRGIKACLFKQAEEMDGFNRVLKSNPDVPLLRRSGPGHLELSMPRSVFDNVCNMIIGTHRHNAFKVLAKLFTTLFAIAFFFMVIWEYDVFGDISSSSETLLSMITVAIPKLLGVLKSAAYRDILVARYEYTVFVRLNKITVPRDNSQTSDD